MSPKDVKTILRMRSKNVNFDTIAHILGRSTAAVRQQSSRAKRSQVRNVSCAYLCDCHVLDSPCEEAHSEEEETSVAEKEVHGV